MSRLLRRRTSSTRLTFSAFGADSASDAAAVRGTPSSSTPRSPVTSRACRGPEMTDADHNKAVATVSQLPRSKYVTERTYRSSRTPPRLIEYEESSNADGVGNTLAELNSTFHSSQPLHPKRRRTVFPKRDLWKRIRSRTPRVSSVEIEAFYDANDPACEQKDTQTDRRRIRRAQSRLLPTFRSSHPPMCFLLIQIWGTDVRFAARDVIALRIAAVLGSCYVHVVDHRYFRGQL